MFDDYVDVRCDPEVFPPPGQARFRPSANQFSPGGGVIFDRKGERVEREGERIGLPKERDCDGPLHRETARPVSLTQPPVRVRRTPVIAAVLVSSSAAVVVRKADRDSLVFSERAPSQRAPRSVVCALGSTVGAWR